jgi:PAS domain S-box-containing protein
MTLAEIHTVAPRCPWNSREDFLLLPGDGLILVDGNGVITYFDHQARRLMGRKPGCRIGDALHEIWPELGEALEAHSDAASFTGPVDTLLTCGGHPATVRLFRTDTGMGIALLSERPAMDQASQQHLLMQQRILQQIRDAVLVTTAEPVDSPGPVIVFANQAALRQTGYRLEEILGRSPRLFQGPATGPAALAAFHAALRHWQPVRQRLLNYRKDGSSFWVEIDIAPLEDSDGWYTYWVSVQRECEGP